MYVFIISRTYFELEQIGNKIQSEQYTYSVEDVSTDIVKYVLIAHSDMYL